MRAVTMVAMTVALALGFTCRRERSAPRSDQKWRLSLQAEGIPTASARIDTVAMDRAGATLVAGTFRGTLRLGKHVVRSVSDADGFAAKIGSDGEPRWLVGLGCVWVSRRSLGGEAAGDAVIAGSGHAGRNADGRPREPFNLTKLRGGDGSVVWRRLDEGGALEIAVASEEDGAVFVAGTGGSAWAAKWKTD